jgi:hypothetical protein
VKSRPELDARFVGGCGVVAFWRISLGQADS